MEILAFTGKRGHGKSTAAEALVKEFGYVHLNFADPLRQVCNIAYGVTFEEMLHPVMKEQPVTYPDGEPRWPYRSPRELLQYIGTDMFRAFIDDTWVQAWAISVGKAQAAGAPGVVCSDCRFLNEAEKVRSLGGKIIRIDDPRKKATDAASLHQSETEIDLIVPNWTIRNDRGVRDLELAALMMSERG